MGFYGKRVLILNQRTPGFTADGAKLNALLTAEKIGGETTVFLRSTNLAALSEGNYFLTLCGETDVTIPLGTLPQKPIRTSELAAEEGLTALLWTEGESGVLPVAVGLCGRIKLSEARLLQKAKEFSSRRRDLPKSGFYEREFPYVDDALATDDYFQREKENEERKSAPRANERPAQSTVSQAEQKMYAVYHETNENAARGGDERADRRGISDPRAGAREGDRISAEVPLSRENGNQPAAEETPEGAEEKPLEGAIPSERANPSATEAALPFFGECAEEPSSPKEPCFFEKEREKLLSTLTQNPEERPLCRAVPGGYFVRVAGERRGYVAGVVTALDGVEKEDLEEISPADVRLLVYGVAAWEGEAPPDDLAEFCIYLPIPSDHGDGYFLLCQNAKTGKPERLFSV